MKRPLLRVAVAALLLAVLPAPSYAVGVSSKKPVSCKPSQTTLKASPTRVKGFTTAQIINATDIINAGARLKVPQHGQALAVMTALQASNLDSKAGLFGIGTAYQPTSVRTDTAKSAAYFYTTLTKVKGWQNMTPTLAAHAAQHNLDPNAYTAYWAEAQRLFDGLTTGTGIAGLQNLAARAQAVAACQQATLKGRFAINAFTKYVGPLPPDVLISRAMAMARAGGGWHNRCQAFVAILDGHSFSGYSTALDAWQTFVAQGVAHPVTSDSGVSPPPGAWLYYASSNPAGHVVTYLGNGQVAGTDTFSEDHVGIGPASWITDGPWHSTYLGWAPPWGQG